MKTFREFLNEVKLKGDYTVFEFCEYFSKTCKMNESKDGYKYCKSEARKLNTKISHLNSLYIGFDNIGQREVFTNSVLKKRYKAIHIEDEESLVEYSKFMLKVLIDVNTAKNKCIENIEGNNRVIDGGLYYDIKKLNNVIRNLNEVFNIYREVFTHSCDKDYSILKYNSFLEKVIINKLVIEEVDLNGVSIDKSEIEDIKEI